jgi:phosphatidylserine/phosphatidylglycerophosphate/cardiolipin synthase-like enzyme
LRLAHVDVATSRTEPAFRGRPRIAEIRRLGLACIVSAKSAIYLENQYFTSKLMTQALLERLGEPDGPEIILILPGRAPSWFDRITMDHARTPLLLRLMRGDRFGRFRAFFPQTASGDAIIVHSKVSVFDDRVARVGSANLNNRSEGFDTECELAIEAGDPCTQREVERLRDQLIAHYLGVSEEALVRARRHAGGLIPAIDLLNDAGRLVPIVPTTLRCWDRFVSRHRLGDPADVEESWRLFKDRSPGAQQRIDPAQRPSGTSAPA